MGDNVLESVRATVQDFLAPEIRTHGVRLDGLDRRLEDTKHSLEMRLDELKGSLEHRLQDSKQSSEQRSDDLKSGLEHRILDAKETLRAEMQATEARMDRRFAALENMIGNLAHR